MGSFHLKAFKSFSNAFRAPVKLWLNSRDLRDMVSDLFLLLVFWVFLVSVSGHCFFLSCFKCFFFIGEFSFSDFLTTNWSESYPTFGSFGTVRKFSEAALVKVSAWKGLIPQLIGKQLLFWTTHKHFKSTVTRHLVPSPAYCSLSIAIAINTTFAIWRIMFL